MLRVAGLVMAAGLAGAGTVAAARPDASLALLSRVAAGQWEVHEIGARAAPRRLCVSDPAALLQVRHGPRACTRTPITTGPRAATVHYDCHAAGYGQTVLTVERPALVRIQTQGIANGQPFDLDLEARRVGACTH